MSEMSSKGSRTGGGVMTAAALVIAVAACVVFSACGEDSSTATPGAPTPSTPTVSSLAISGPDAVRTRFFSNYTATATLSNGTTQTVTPAWTSSSPAVATVDSAGRVDGLTHGSTNLAASYQGVSASKTVNIVQNYGGNWTGTYAMQACDQSGVFASIHWCQELGGAGAILPFSLALTQTGNGRDEISGTISHGSLAGNISGSVSGDGRLVIGGSYNVTTSDVTFTVQVGGWETRAAPGDSMTGGWASNLSAVGVAGNAYQQNRIVAVTHTSQQTNVSAAPQRYVLSLSDLFERLRH